MVAAGWWASAPPQQRQHAIGGRMLMLPDGTWWLFGAWARWYRLHPSDGQWYLCPPPLSPAVRMAARPAQHGSGQVPALPPHVVPAGPDFSYSPPISLPFVGHGFATDLTYNVRSTVESAAALPTSEYPHWWSQFTPETPSTVAVSWGVMLWCCSAPAFDSRLDGQMLDLWKPYKAKPLPDVDGPRWLTPPPLEALVGLYAERLRASRVDAAVVVLRTMWAVASVLREDPRFQVRADALLEMLSATLSNPTVDYGALPYGDQALVQQWLTRCPPHLVPALRNESSPGDNFRHAYYSLAEVIGDLAGDPADPAYIEPRLVAAALVAADLDVVRKEMAANIVPWLDPEIRYTVQAVGSQAGHPLRRLWPTDQRLPDPLRAALAQGDAAERVLAATYEVDLAWCRLAGMPARPRGFPVPTAVIAELIGRERARATAAAGSTGAAPAAPAYAQHQTPLSSQSQPGLKPGAPPQPMGMPEPPGQPYVQPPAQPGAGGPHGFNQAQPPPPPAAAAAQPSAEEQEGENYAPPYTELGFQRPGGAPPAPVQAASPVPPPPPGQPGQPPQPYAAQQPPPGVPAPPQAPVPPGAAAVPAEEQPESEHYAPPYTELGFQPAGAPPAGFQGGPPQPQGQPPQQQPPGQPPQPPGQPPQPPGQPPQPPGQPPQPQPQPQAAQQAQFGQPAPVPPEPEKPVDPYATRFDEGAGKRRPQGQPVPPAPQQQGPPGTRIMPPGGVDGDQPGGAGGGGAPPGGGTRIMSETMVGDFDFLDHTPSPDTPIHEIPPPQESVDRRVLERYGISLVSGSQDAGELLDDLRGRIESWHVPGEDDIEATRVDGRPSAMGVPSILLVGGPHTGQRRLARMIALTAADAGLGDGSIRAADADDVREAPAEGIARILGSAAQQPNGPGAGGVVLFERLDVAVTTAADPVASAAAVRRARRDPSAGNLLIATCEPRAFKRLAKDHPRLTEIFRVYRMPDLTELDDRMTLLHLLADERRVTLANAALEVAREDLARLRGPGDLVNARLVETYLDKACQRSLERAGASRDRLVLTPDDLSGVAESIEPALRPPGDIDGYLRRLDGLSGLTGVKAAVRELIEEARLAADRARYGVESGSRHLVFTGPPGTGKTTVATLLGGIYAALGLLDSGHVVACRPVHLAGRDQLDTEGRVAGMVDQALGGVLLIQEAYRLDRSPDVVRELLDQMEERADRFVIICSSPGAEMEGFLSGNPAFRAEMGRVLEFEGMGDRDLVRLFQDYAERDLYMLDEELRVELLSRFARMRQDPAFAYARTIRGLFEQTVARQAARLAGADVNAATVARLTARDLPESPLEQMLGDFHQGR
ncbi:AAA family ATPase [Actinomadura barringtoniae]|uniref:AAA family ATPase n=1 Tax=Actinomadura barringtoniae TaxID=1427535 RepID=A0A939PKF5_9ACTN|nr:AAA family ATPase [Actinomadura barringtoniae]MBO2454275.1 AAA family ATPase [Actinomadura barringtoniae]